MAIDIYKVYNGLGIYGKSSILSGTGAPGGDASFQDTAALGSLFLRIDVPGLYLKTGTANTTADWTLFSNGSAGTIITPANAADQTSYANIAAAEAAYDVSNTVDGVAILAGFRILLTNLTTGSKTVYIVGGSIGSWTLTPDTFTPTAGDEIYVIAGTNNGGDIFTYDGSNWNVQSGSTIINEIGYIRNFIGKSAAGNSMPTYSSNNFVTNGTSLEAAIGAIDAGLKPFGQSGTSLNITTATTVDTVNCRTYDTVLWLVKIVDHASPANKQTLQIHAIHDGTSSVDAANVDFNAVSIISVGTIPTGLTYDVVLSGTGSSQTMGLQITSTTAVDAKVARVRL
jgi:hypothetical protein